MGLEKTLKDLYVTILLFLLKSHKYIAQSTARRYVNFAITSNDIEKLLSDVAQKEAEIQKFESIELKHMANEQFMLIRASLGAYDDHLEQEHRARILDWISTIDYRSHHLDVHNRLLPGTAKWLFQKQDYRRWRESPVSSLLWLRGDGI